MPDLRINSFSGIELTSICNLRCHYCPQPKMERQKVHMDRRIFNKAMYWLDQFKQTTPIYLHNFGESTLHPDLLDMIAEVRARVPYVGLSTNGVGVSKELVQGMKDAGLTKLSISVHRPEAAQWVVAYCRELGMPYDIAGGPMDGTHDWAGQVKAPKTLMQKFDCHYLRNQECVVLADGRLAACCIDAEGQSAQGSVFHDLTKLYFKPFKLCIGCHHQVPEDIFPNWRKEIADEALSGD